MKFIFTWALLSMFSGCIITYEPFIGTRALPMEVFKNADSILLVSTLANDTCCGQKLKFENNLAELKLSSCTGDVTCEMSPGFKKNLIENECDVGIPMDGGCVVETTEDYICQMIYL